MKNKRLSGICEYLEYVLDANQIKEVYRDMADKAEYPSFDIWLADMLKSGIFTEL